MSSRAGGRHRDETPRAFGTKVCSPDESIQIHFSIPAGPRVRIHHGKFRQHTETSLAEQLERALAGSQSGCRSAVGKAFSEPPTLEPGSPEARFVMARQRRARELARDVVTEHDAKLSAISTTVTREIGRSTLEEMISERSS